MQRIICNVSTGEINRVNLTSEEIAELQARAAAYVPPVVPAPTKDELLAELQALTAKINALE
jgi:dihydrodipicolinate synthase/N-acetylneuraminate lyase